MSIDPVLERLKYRLGAVTSGKAKLEKLIASDPNSNRVDGWKRRLMEYEDSIAGLPALIRQRQDRLDRKTKAGSHSVSPPKVGG